MISSLIWPVLGVRVWMETSHDSTFFGVGRTRSSIAGIWIWIWILNTSNEWFMDCGDTGAVRVIYQKSATHSVVIYDSVRNDETSVFTWLSFVLIFCFFSARPPHVLWVTSAAISMVCGSISGQCRLKFYFSYWISPDLRQKCNSTKLTVSESLTSQ